MGFYFPLSSVLRVREAAEQREERALQEITSEIEVATQSLEEVTHRLTESESRHQNDGESILPGYHLQAWYGQRESLADNKRHLLEQIEKLNGLRVAQLTAYRSARQHREVLDSMREKVLAEFETDVDRREQRAADDQHAARRSRKQPS